MFLYKEYFLSLMFVVTTCSLLLLFPCISYAETRVHAEDTLKGGVWDEKGSPYILEESIYVPDGVALSIEKGVHVLAASSSPLDEPYTMTFDGDVTVTGTSAEPVVFKDLHTLFFSTNTVFVEYAVFHSTGFNFKRSTSTLKNISITGATKAISAKGSRITVASSEIQDNEYGIFSYPDGVVSPQLARGDNALSISPQNTISIHDSVIQNNKKVHILNQVENTIDARNNWWGAPEGPDAAKISGTIDIDPWKEVDPQERTCCSNVLFLPGFQASRLGKKLEGATTTLWEPKRNENVRALYMNDVGKSIDKNIVPLGVIGSAYMLKPIYKEFVAMMNGVVADGGMHEWFPFSYDWRMNVGDIVDDKLIRKVLELASTSRTGKVTFVAHSNGGLVAKELVRRLEALGEGERVDTMILVATPELGAPQAVLGMLHGDKQAIGLGALLSKKNARAFSYNMPGAYGLLPSRDFFTKNTLPVITTNSRPITTYDEMKKFLTENPWSGASTSPLSIPMKLKPALVSLAESLHLSLDTWRPSSSAKIISVFGWGVETGAGVEYKTFPHCSTPKNCKIERGEVLTERGDGTVISESAPTVQKDGLFFFNIKKFGQETKDSINHANILEAQPILNFLKAHITGGVMKKEGEGEYENYFSETEPASTGKQLTLRFHSPVDVDVYAPDGRHTGLIPNPVPDSDLLWMENQIGAYVSGFGEEEDVKHVSIPYGPEYQIVVRGNGAGAVIIDAEIRENDRDIIATTTFLEMPVTPMTNIDLVIATSSEKLGTASLMYLDVDGDGTTDLIQRSAEALKASPTSVVADFSAYLEAMRKTIIALQLPAKQEKIWLEKLDKILAKTLKKHPRKAEKIAKKLSTKRFKNKKLTEEQKTAILKVFETLATRLETETFTDIDQ